jgi:putative NADH-flavin reductase
MSKIIVFGAHGRLGRLAVAEAERRGHGVTVAGRATADTTDPESVAGAAAGHDAAIASLYQETVPHDAFYAAAAAALLRGLERAGVGRLLFVGMAANLEVAPGRRILDTDAFPPEHLAFALGHTAALHVLRASNGPVDWLMLTPPMTLDADAPTAGRYRTGGDAVLGERLSYADLATALVDEIERPQHHRTRIAVAG